VHVVFAATETGEAGVKKQCLRARCHLPLHAPAVVVKSVRHPIHVIFIVRMQHWPWGNIRIHSVGGSPLRADADSERPARASYFKDTML
jgi:hypothetical protein